MVSIEDRDKDGCTPLHVALLSKQVQVVKALLEARANPNKRLEGSPPTHIALSVGALQGSGDFATEAVKLLLAHQADCSIKDDKAQNVLHLTAKFGQDEAMAVFLGQGEAIEELLQMKERLGNRPLHLAAEYGHISTLKKLLKAGSNINARNIRGCTALHSACIKGQWACAKVLLEHSDADATITDKEGITAGQWALRRGLRIPSDLSSLLPPGSANGTVATDSEVHPSSTSSQPASHLNYHLDDLSYHLAGLSDHLANLSYHFLSSLTHSPLSSPQELPSTLILHHPLCERHFSCLPIIRRGPSPPPENVNRLKVIYGEGCGVLRSKEFEDLEWNSEPNRAQLADVLRVHEYSYVEHLQKLCRSIEDTPFSLKHLDGDTAVSHSSFEAAMRAAGSVCDAIDRCCAGRRARCRNAFCAVRPPGHHAGARGVVTCHNDGDGSHGFCLLNNVAIGAAYARNVYRKHGIQKVAIVDFDVHHGNGTEDIIKCLVPTLEETSVNLPWCSGSMQRPMILDVGMGMVNHSDAPSASRHKWRDVYRNHVLPKLTEFDPDIILISAGFDAHKKDVINFGYISIVEEDYEWLTQQLVQVANKCCDGRIVSVLEGGYRIQGGPVSAFGRSVAAHVRALKDGAISRHVWSEEESMWESEFEAEMLAAWERKRKMERIKREEEAFKARLESLHTQAMHADEGEQADGEGEEGEDGKSGERAKTNGGADGEAKEAAQEGTRGSKRAEAPAEAAAAEPAAGRSNKRRRGNVDYVALGK
ncbi:unnamed protein product, partial [Chrysoparadoxa australica]